MSTANAKFREDASRAGAKNWTNLKDHAKDGKSDRLARSYIARLALLRVIYENNIDVFVHPENDRVSESDDYLSSMTGLPEMFVPIGRTPEGSRRCWSFSGGPHSEPTLIRPASWFETQTHHRKPPRHTPTLQGERFDY